MNTKYILSALLIGGALVGCSQEEPKATSQREQTIRFESEFDPSYEFDDDDARAARFSGIEVPRIVLDDSDFSAIPTSASRSITSLRLNLLALDAQNNIQNQSRYRGNGAWIKGFSLFLYNGQRGGIFTHPAKIQVKKQNNGYKLSLECRWTDHPALYPITGAAWFGQLNLGGATGYELDSSNGWGYIKQYFSHEIPRVANEAQKRTEPNDEIREVLPGEPIQRRHFPMIGELVPLKLFTKSDNPVPPGSFNDQGNNQAILGDRGNLSQQVTIRPRGSIIVIKLSNETGRDIDVVNLQSPLGRGFDFEGCYDTNQCHPFPAGTDGVGLEKKTEEELRQMIDPAGIVAPFVPFNSYTRDNAQRTHRIFALRSSRADNANPLAIGKTSEGVYMLWVHANSPNKPLRLRVNYYSPSTESWHNSLTQEVTPPEGGFADGKAYRATLRIKVDPDDAPRS